ncbi:phosphopentomutase [Natribacillus halophilus]|uniref:Phosphopentomutase n=1 Tax=Natribacillus halophilus TaxID=549003 RepID=A0A1G8N477_9BACI|nr:phosphopentomutase [Natribacillus halophilus]SDI74968.1 Phosphopentomutase [Natribacillus halophilus]
MGKMILLVLDGFGIGAMEDCREYEPADCNANTYRHIREHCSDFQLPILENLGLSRVANGTGTANAAFGRSALAHHGADTYMGHQEIAGTIPKRPQKRLMKDIHDNLAQALLAEGYKIEYPWEDRPLLLVEDAIVVGDNLESSYGNIINLTADFKRIPFEKVKEVARIVRQNVDTSRVIAFGGPHTSIEDVLSVVKENNPGQWGVDTPRAQVYGEGYEVFHMGHGVQIERQFPMVAAQHDVPVYRIGKTADVLHGEGEEYPFVNTGDVLQKLEECYRQETKDAAFLVNVQETDLAGHAEDVEWYVALLQEVDAWLEEFIPQLEEDDVLLITADHGNDPTIGHSKHTREYTPLLVTGPKVRTADIGTRKTMADIGATFCDYFALPATESGDSFLWELYERES